MIIKNPSEQFLLKVRRLTLKDGRWRKVIRRNKYLENLYKEAAEGFKSLNFKFETPAFGLIDWEWLMVLTDLDKDVMAVCIDDNDFFPKKDGSIILFVYEVFQYFRKDEKLLKCILAHELGHAIIDQTGRRGHPFFDNLRGRETETLADDLAGYLYGDGLVNSKNQKIRAEWRISNMRDMD